MIEVDELTRRCRESAAAAARSATQIEPAGAMARGEARRRRATRHRGVIGGVLVVSVAFAIGLPLALRPVAGGLAVTATVRPPVGDLAVSDLVWGAGQPRPVALVGENAASGSPLTLPLLYRGEAQPQTVATGSWIVWVSIGDVSNDPHYGTAVAFRPGSTTLTQLGLATELYPGGEPGTVWLFLDHSAGSGSSGPCSVQLVSAGGARLSDRLPFPCRPSVLGAVPGGLVVSPDLVGSPDVWYTSGRRSPLAGFTGASTGGATVADATWKFCSGTCAIRVADTRTRRAWTVRVRAPAGLSFMRQISVSSDGQFLALKAVPTRLVGIASAYNRVEISAYDPEVTGAVVVLQATTGRVAMYRSASFVWLSALTWSPDDGYLFTSDATIVNGTRRVVVGALPAWSGRSPVRAISVPNGLEDPERFIVVRSPMARARR